MGFFSLREKIREVEPAILIKCRGFAPYIFNYASLEMQAFHARVIKNAPNGAFYQYCGERGIRTPGPVTVNGFQDRRNRPLCHLSGANVHSPEE